MMSFGFNPEFPEPSIALRRQNDKCLMLDGGLPPVNVSWYGVSYLYY